jgi:DNA-binding NarL/FixJ family response regulator
MRHVWVDALDAGADHRRMPLTRVLLADGQRSFVEALGMRLDAEDDLQVVATVVRAEDALGIVDTRPVDVAVLAVSGDGNGFISVGRPLLTTRPGIKLVGMADADDTALLVRAVRQGFRGWVHKDVMPDELVSVVHAVCRGETCIPPLLLTRLLTHLVQDERPRAAQAPLASLTPRELEVLKVMSSGATRKEVAEQLAISSNTVRTHMQSVLNKLNVHTSLAAVTLARRAGLA